ncbi:MAG: hypothetical protein AMXMBFR58_38530 [Phycisphaerae bacterium]
MTLRRFNTARERRDPFSIDVFTVEAEYAIRTMAVLAARALEAPVPALAVAEATQVPARQLDRVLGKLVRHGLARRTRGGFSLSRPARDIQVLEVIRAFQRLERIRSCPLGRPDHCGGLCPIHSRLDKAIESIATIFGDVSLQQLVDEPLRPVRPPEFPPPSA